MHAPRSPRSAAALLLLLALSLAVVAACGTGGANPTDDALTAPLETAGHGSTEDEDPEIDEPRISPGADAGEPETTQSDTAWGRIWDRKPDDFPMHPDAVPSEELPDGDPVSGVFSVAEEPAAVAAWMQAALERATYSTEALSGPLDDGTIVIDSVGEGGCRIETTLYPQAAGTMIAVRYGADCPYD